MCNLYSLTQLKIKTTKKDVGPSKANSHLVKSINIIFKTTPLYNSLL